MKQIAILKIDYKQMPDGRIAILEFGGGMTSGITGIPGGANAFNENVCKQLLELLDGEPLYLSTLEGYEESSHESTIIQQYIEEIKKENPNANLNHITIENAKNLARSGGSPINLMLFLFRSKMLEIESIALQHEFKKTKLNITLINGSSALPALTRDKGFSSLMLAHYLEANDISYKPISLFIGDEDSEDEIAKKIDSLPVDKQYLIKPIDLDTQTGIIFTRSKAEIINYLQLIKKEHIYELQNLVYQTQHIELNLSIWLSRKACLIQEFISGKMINILGVNYNPTGRSFFIAMQKDSYNIDVKLLYSYWILPREASEDKDTYINSISHISKIGLSTTQQVEQDQQIITNFLKSENFKYFLSQMLVMPIQALVSNIKRQKQNVALINHIINFSFAFSYPALYLDQINPCDQNKLANKFSQIFYQEFYYIYRNMLNQIYEIQSSQGARTISSYLFEFHLSNSMYYGLCHTYYRLFRIKEGIKNINEDYIATIFKQIIFIYLKLIELSGNDTYKKIIGTNISDLRTNISGYIQQYHFFSKQFNLPDLTIPFSSTISTNFFQSQSNNCTELLKTITGLKWNYSSKSDTHWRLFSTDKERKTWEDFFSSIGIKIQSSMTKPQPSKPSQPILILHSITPDLLNNKTRGLSLGS